MTQDHMDTQVLDDVQNSSPVISEQEDSWSLAHVFGLDNCCGALFAHPTDDAIQEPSISSESSGTRTANPLSTSQING